MQEEGLQLLGWRDVPVSVFDCGHSARATRPDTSQILLGEESLILSALKESY